MNLESLIQDIYKLKAEELTLDTIKRLKRDFARENGLKDVPSNIQLLGVYHKMLKEDKMNKDLNIENILKKRGIRSQSGIVSVQVLTKPFPCPGKCIFCPTDVTMPKSYINTEPGAMRALLNQFDPKKQVYNRLLSLKLTGHQTDKIEMIVLGGTWDVYPKEYKKEFVKGLYDACNTFSQLKTKDKDSGSNNRFSYEFTNLDGVKYPETLEESIKLNETTDNRIIGLTVETRPEFVTDENCRFRRELGVTRLEMGVQSMYDDVLDANKRGHDVQCIRNALHKLRQYAFKFSIHIMPGLYKSNYEKDLGTFQQIYSDEYVKPDEIKFYPTSVIPNTELFDLYEKGEYKPLKTNVIKDLIKETFYDIVPPYTRIKRLIRDIPSTEIAAGSSVTNLSQLTHKEIKDELRSDSVKSRNFYNRLYGNYKLFNSVEEFLSNVGDDGEMTYIIGQDPNLETYRNFVSLDTRSREIRNRGLKENGEYKKDDKSQIANLIIRKYKSSVGREYFISFEDELGYLYGFARLCLPNDDKVVERDGLGNNIAMIRELHVYGQLASLKEKNIKKDTQHKGFGSQLMDVAEKLSALKGYNKLSVISGVGVRKYYEKIGYNLEGTYMIKDLK